MTSIHDTIKVAETRISELKLVKVEIEAHAKKQMESYDKAVENLIAFIKERQEKTKKEFEMASKVEQNIIVGEEQKYEKAIEELKTKDVELGNIIDILGNIFAIESHIQKGKSWEMKKKATRNLRQLGQE